MVALIAVDVQNEFSKDGLRAVPNYTEALARIQLRASQARESGAPIAWIQHHNRPNESRAFVPGTWGAELAAGFGPRAGSASEKLFQKDVFGAFTGTTLEKWLSDLAVTDVLLVGFYSHMCVSTSSREALVRGFNVQVDPLATGATEIKHEQLGTQSAEEVRRSALLHLSHMGVTFAFDEASPFNQVASHADATFLSTR
jgi:nicotinamidase-related amidase